MHTNSIRDAIAAGNPRLVMQFGSVLKYLPVEQIVRCMDFHETDDYRVPFELADMPGNQALNATSLAYFSVCCALIETLPKPAAAQVLFPSLPRQCGFIFTEAIDYDLSEILVGLVHLWKRIDTAGLAEFYNPIYKKMETTLSAELAESLATNQLDESTTRMVELASTENIALTGRVFAAMHLATCPDFYSVWGVFYDGNAEDRIDYFFEQFKNGRAAAIGEYIKLLKPLASDPKASVHLDEIEVARKKYLALQSAVNETNLSARLQRLLLTSRVAPNDPLKLKLNNR